VDSPDRKGAVGRRTAPGSRLRYVAWPSAAALVAADAVLLVYTPPRWRVEVASVLTMLMLAIVVVVTLRIARRKAAGSIQQAPPVMYRAASHPPQQDPDAPSERIRLAYELARRRVPGNWIAARCALPHAFVELIIAEVADSPGAPRRRDQNYD
jgi:hypothetical protein